jgi:hypothetical protein
MLFLPILVLVLIGIGVATMVRHRTAHAAGPAGTGVTVEHREHHLAPTTRVGVWSLWLLALAFVAQLALTTVVIWGGAPFAAVAMVLAIVAMTRHHDRSPLLWIVVAVGLLFVAFPFAFWIGG